MSSPTTFCAAFQATAARRPTGIALRTADDTTVLTWQQYADRVRTVAAGLAGLGVGAGDTVGIMLTNRPEFHLVDTAVLHLGATPFSIYNTSAPEQIAYLFGNAGNRVVVGETQFVDRLLAARAAGVADGPGSPGSVVEHVVCVDGAPPGTVSLAAVEAAPAPDFDFAAAWTAVGPDDVLTIIYTSGTTGPPKGVELTHASMLAEVAALTSYMPVGFDDSVVSYLPDAHVANRWGAHYTNLVTGMQIVTLADLRGLVAALPAVRPTFFGAVPQVWYRVKAAIEAALAAEPSPARRRVATWALGVGREVARRESDRRPVPVRLRVAHRVADRLVIGRVRPPLGLDRVRCAASGAAAISRDALEFVLALGLPVCEVWGMSETSAVALANPPGAVRIGTVGPVVPGIEARLADDGELLVRGPQVMRGYRGDPERTAEAIDADGWLHTGDVATMDADGYVTIVDRKKELIINAAGKNMSPTNIEGVIQLASPLIGPLAVIGDNRPYVVALITLDPEAVAAWAGAHGRPDPTPAALATDPELYAAVEAGVQAANQRLSRVEQVRRFAILPDVWEPGGEQLTPTLKLKRRPIADRYADDIAALYA